jgi:hypothetical protein
MPEIVRTKNTPYNDHMAHTLPWKGKHKLWQLGRRQIKIGTKMAAQGNPKLSRKYAE